MWTMLLMMSMVMGAGSSLHTCRRLSRIEGHIEQIRKVHSQRQLRRFLCCSLIAYTPCAVPVLVEAVPVSAEAWEFPS